MCWVYRTVRKYNSKAFAIWFYNDTGFKEMLCKEHLDTWLDNADDDDGLEPSNVIFL